MKFNYYAEWILEKNFYNHHEYEKMINTGKLRVYSSFPSVYHLLNSGSGPRATSSGWSAAAKKKHMKNRVKFK